MVPYDDDGDVSVFITKWGDGAAPGKDSNYQLLWDTLVKAFPQKDEYVVTVEKSLYHITFSVCFRLICVRTPEI
jgi:hypothetical protein